MMSSAVRATPRTSKDRLRRGILRILCVDADFVIQGKTGYDLQTAIRDFNSVEPSAGTSRRNTCRRFAGPARLRIDRPKNAVSKINVFLGHACCADGPTEAGIGVFHAYPAIADLSGRHVSVVTRPIRRLTTH